VAEHYAATLRTERTTASLAIIRSLIVYTLADHVLIDAGESKDPAVKPARKKLHFSTNFGDMIIR
jgi:hypothetical protein